MHRDSGGDRCYIVGDLCTRESRMRAACTLDAPEDSGTLSGMRIWTSHSIENIPELPEAPNLECKKQQVLHAPEAALQGRGIAAEGRVTPCDHLAQRGATGDVFPRLAAVLDCSIGFRFMGLQGP